MNLDTHITLDKEAILSPNLCDRFSVADLNKIGECVIAGYEADERSRSAWLRRMESAMDLALQLQKQKSFPWAGCSNVAFPLVTIAAMQFHSRAYPTIINGNDVVKCRVIGEDPTGEQTARAERVSTHMSWQVLEQDESWEEQKDRLLLNLPIVGTTFVKSRRDAIKGYNVNETILAKDLVLDYWAKSVEACPRKTQILSLFPNDLHTGIMSGIYRDVREEAWYGKPPATSVPNPQADARADARKGQNPPPPDDHTPYVGLEQHVDLDLDGDGYAEPYIITVEKSSGCVLRIVTGFDREEDILRNARKEVISIRRTEYFTKYGFIPSPDGGIYDIGFGILLGPLNESVNSIINQLIDNGTMQVTKGGFLGKGAKIRGGVQTFAPFQWNRVDSSGDDLRKNIVPLEVGEPSAVLFNLLSLLINYVNRIAGTTDPMVGENPGQNTPAENMRTMVEQGAKIYSAVFKRIWRCMKQEFKKNYVLNAIYMTGKTSFGKNQFVFREDYLGNPDAIAPAADPNLTSEQMALNQAMTLKQFAATTPGYNAEAVERRVLKLMKVDAIDQIYPGASKTGTPKDTKLQIAEMQVQVKMAALQAEQARFAAQLMEEQRINNAEIAKIYADIQNARETLAGDAQDRQIGALNAMLGMMKTKNDVLMKRIDVILKAMEVKREQGSVDGGGLGGMEATPNDGAGVASGAAEAAGLA